MIHEQGLLAGINCKPRMRSKYGFPAASAGNSGVRSLMRQINFANLKRTVYFLKRNGIKNTCFEIKERLEAGKQPPYVWVPVSSEQLAAQRRRAEEEKFNLKFSIVVPAYRTPENCLREMTESLLAQSYPDWELILADATEEEVLSGIIEEFHDARLRYVHLNGNQGISENTNRALELAFGDYVGLLDHDDVLTPDALYEMAVRIREERQGGREPMLLYSDEDKCNGDMTVFYEPNQKEDFNLDLLLCNNYICHFMVMKTELIQKLRFRKEYDGAQDYDLALRAVEAILGDKLKGGEEFILHIPKVLYHWRCHSGSTAENPWSKEYAYEAGRRAVQSFADKNGWKAKAVNMSHPGFYRLEYNESPLKCREDLGAIGGRLKCKGRVTGGRMTAEGKVLYEGLPLNYSGYLHRAALQQDAAALDIRNIVLKDSLRTLFKEIAGVSYIVSPGTEKFDASVLSDGTDPVEISLRLGKALRERGYRLLYLPE